MSENWKIETCSVHAFKPVPPSDELIRRLYDRLRWGPAAFDDQQP